MMTAEEIRDRVLEAIPESEVDVIDTVGDSNHWRVVVTSTQFEGKSLIDQHKMVMAPFQDVLGGRMHAIEIKTMLPQAS